MISGEEQWRFECRRAPQRGLGLKRRRVTSQRRLGSISKEGGRMTKIWDSSKRDAETGHGPDAEVRCEKCKFMFPPLSAVAVGWYAV